MVTPWTRGFFEVQLEVLRTRGEEIDVLRVPFTRGPRIVVAALSFILGLLYQPERKPSLIHCYGSWPAGITGSILARRLGVPLIIHEHLGPPSRLNRLPLVKRVLKRADDVVCPDYSHSSEVSRISGRKTSVVMNPVIGGQIEDRARSRAVLCVGRASPEKNFSMIVEAARLCPDINFVMVMDGPERKRLESRAPDNVLFTGELPHDDVLMLMGRCITFAAPSRYESFGVAAAEARASGCYVIATDVGIHRDISNLIMSQFDGPEDWADAILRSMSERSDPMVLPECHPGNFHRAIRSRWNGALKRVAL